MRIIAWSLLILAIAAAAVAVHASREAAARRAALLAGASFVDVDAGRIAFAIRGPRAARGETPILVVHGAGGGFDQGLLLAEALIGEADGRMIVAPSRFGYLGSSLPADASTAAQGDAFAKLLDHLGADQADVVAISGGVPPSLQFAHRHPQRVRRLALVSSAPFTPYGPEAAERTMPDWAYSAAFGNDAAFWALSRLGRGRLLEAMDARADLLLGASPEERTFAAAMVDAIAPASARIDGLMNEGAAIDPSATYPLEEMVTPTLVIHARDDRLNPFAIGEALAARLPDAQFAPMEAGGHLLLGRHAETRARIERFLAPGA